MYENERVIWSNRDLDIEDGWREAYAEFIETNELDRDPEDEDAIYRYMVETNGEYLGDERMNLDIQFTQPIIAIADLGLWDGRRTGYKEIESGNIKDCLHCMNDYDTFYVDVEGDLRHDSVHHDGTNHILYRVFKDDVTEDQIEDFKDKIYDGSVTREDIDAITMRLGDEIAKVYGWDLNAPPIDMSPYMDKGFDKQQLAQIKAALQVGILTADKIAIFAKPEFSAPQMAQLRYGLEAGLDMEPYAKPEINWEALAEIRKELLEEEKYGFALNDKITEATEKSEASGKGADKTEIEVDKD